jgi:ubiquitin carboxyl-terminal hydrolase 36/42
MVLHKLPNVLVIHLKRFSYGNMFAKITKPVQFGVDLVVQSGQGAKVRYELHGVVVHHGHSTHSGHYIAYVKVSIAWMWDRFHDECNACAIHIKILA